VVQRLVLLAEVVARLLLELHHQDKVIMAVKVLAETVK
jgi:hypothetical protein